jgi:hypothetical protein
MARVSRAGSNACRWGRDRSHRVLTPQQAWVHTLGHLEAGAIGRARAVHLFPLNIQNPLTETFRDFPLCLRCARTWRRWTLNSDHHCSWSGRRLRCQRLAARQWSALHAVKSVGGRRTHWPPGRRRSTVCTICHISCPKVCASRIKQITEK